MSIEFFVATDEEVTALRNFNEICDMLFVYEFCASGANDFQAVRWIADFFFQNDDGIPEKISKSLNCIYDRKSFVVNIYQLDGEFIKKVTAYEIDKIRGREAAEYWHQRGYFSPVIWNVMYDLYRFCQIAVKNNINVNFFEEINESKLDG